MVWVNDAFRETFGVFDDSGWKDRIVHFTISPDHLDTYLDTVRPKFDSGERTFGAETMCIRSDGSTFWSSIALVVLPHKPGGGRYSIAVHRDISALKNREDAARSATEERARLLNDAQVAEGRLAAAINSMPDPVAIWDRQYRMVICNEAFAPRLLGRCKDVPRGTKLQDLLQEAAHSGQFVEAAGREDAWCEEAEDAFRAGPIRGLTEYSDGRVFHANSHIAPNGDTIVVTMDVTELEQKKAELERVNADVRHQALHDDLTGLLNRRGLTQWMDAHDPSDDPAIAALQIDLDHFKSINDTIGHGAGDEVLIETARRLRGAAGPERAVARIGGDEFVVILEGRSDLAAAEAVATALVRSLSRPVEYRGGQIRLGASIGIAQTPVSKAGDILGDADIALYKAKARGRSRVAVFSNEDRKELKAEQALADDILRGLEANEFVPVFQPQVSSTTGLVVGLEVLARWHHPSRGVLPPDAFLSQAEDLHVLDRIDRQVFYKALDLACHAFERGSAPSLAFNVGRQRIMSPEIFEAADIAKGYPGKIAFELLETIFFDEEPESFLLQIDAIRDAGIDIEIDDFGSGRASIVALQRIAPDRLKIDRALVRPMVKSDQSRRLVRSIIDMGRALDIGVTAEGVESDAHARVLAAYGCDRLQGFNFGKPAPLADVYQRFWSNRLKRTRSVLRTAR